MKTIALIPLFVLIFLSSLQAQSDSIIPKKMYRIWVKPIDKGHKVSGMLFEVSDSSLTISHSPKRIDYTTGSFITSKIDIRSIDVIKLRRNHAVLEGILIGGIPMLGIGIISAASLIKEAQENNNPSDVGRSMQNGVSYTGAVLSLLICTGIGVGIGALIGSIKSSYHLRGSQHKYDQYITKLNHRAIKYKDYKVPKEKK
jgi:hypothetical protein